MDYEKYHTLPQFHNLGAGSYQGDLVKKIFPDVESVADFGCGSGHAVRRMRNLFSSVFGYEYSKVAYDKYLSNEGDIFFNDKDVFHALSPDLVYSTEVMEHIPEELVPDVVESICKMGAGHIFMTISLRVSSDNNAYHCTLKSREWWERQFLKFGYEVDLERVAICQVNNERTDSEIFSQWKSVGSAGVEFEKNPPYSLNGEEQPWFFIFKKRSK